MIEVRDKLFHLQTDASSYLFCVGDFGHLEQIYYGPRVQTEDAEALRYRRTMPYGSQVMWDEESEFSLDNLPLNWSGVGRGDFRQPPLELCFADGSLSHDFLFVDYDLCDGVKPMQGLPTATAGDSSRVQTLTLTLQEQAHPLRLQLIYTVFPETNVISRRAVLLNQGEEAVTLHRFLSFLLDLPNRNFRMLSLTGDWIREAERTEQPLVQGLLINQSTTGDSSNRQNPGVILAEAGANEDQGFVYGFNLVYSGNHFTLLELSSHGLVRVAGGINPQSFHWQLDQGAAFETPEAILSFSDQGLNGLSQNFHRFVNEHIVRGPWRMKERPLLLNSWEALNFDFTEKKLLKLAEQGRKLGVELFVLDDGWFGARDNDRAGLGDYTVNSRKLPSGLPVLARRIHEMGLSFGLWLEPESVNPDSDLYRAHPDYAISAPGLKPLTSRHQFLLDLTRQEVRDYIVQEVSELLDSAEIDYVKWDMNRHMSEFYSPGCLAGEFCHRYILGLYEILNRIFGPRPQILLESCSSGGNRFDLGMLAFSPQIWASDNTDPIERLRIQSGLSLFYPLSSMGAHVSLAPHQQTLRNTPLSTRFNVAAFGLLGYELDPGELSKEEAKEVEQQLCFYKRYRRLFQFGKFYRGESFKTNKYQWLCVDESGKQAVALLAQTLARAAESNDMLCLKGLLPEGRYQLKTVPQKLALRRFGHLVKHALPIKIKARSPLFAMIDARYSLDDGAFSVQASGAALAAGICLNNQFIGTGYHKDLRLWGDFGSQLYLLQAEDGQAEARQPEVCQDEGCQEKGRQAEAHKAEAHQSKDHQEESGEEK